jgi:DNA-binding ferritin-like protein
MDQLRGLASLTDLTCPEQAAEALDNLVSALLRTAENFDSMGVIARESADAATAQLLFGWLATLQEAVWRLSEARFEYLNG